MSNNHTSDELVIYLSCNLNLIRKFVLYHNKSRKNVVEKTKYTLAMLDLFVYFPSALTKMVFIVFNAT